MTLQVGGMRMVFLNSSRVAREILDRRSGVFFPLVGSILILYFRSLVHDLLGRLSREFFRMANGCFSPFLSWLNCKDGLDALQRHLAEHPQDYASTFDC